MHLSVQIRPDPIPSSEASELHALLSSIPLNSSSFIPHSDPKSMIRFFRYAIRTFHKKHPNLHLSAYLVSAPGQPSRGRPSVGIQIWKQPRASSGKAA